MGWLKATLGVVVLGAGIYGGYIVGRNHDAHLPYEVKEEGAGYALLDKRNGASLRITENFQLGELEHRVDAAVCETKHDAKRFFNAMSAAFEKHYQAR